MLLGLTGVGIIPLIIFFCLPGKAAPNRFGAREYGAQAGMTPEQQATHPARFALCELVNIHDDSLLFEPIHRALFQVPGEAVQELAEAMDFQLPEDEDRDYDTLGGLVFAQLAVIPEDGSRPVVEALGLRIRVEELCDRRVEWALVEKQAPAAAACE